jgi:hypothetical protein
VYSIVFGFDGVFLVGDILGCILVWEKEENEVVGLPCVKVDLLSK